MLHMPVADRLAVQEVAAEVCEGVLQLDERIRMLSHDCARAHRRGRARTRSRRTRRPTADRRDSDRSSVSPIRRRRALYASDAA